MNIVVVQKSNTFGYVVIHNEFEVFTAAGHSHWVPLIVVELLSGIKNLRAFAWRGRLVSQGMGGKHKQNKGNRLYHILKCLYVFTRKLNVPAIRLLM